MSKITAENLPPVIWQNTKVITTELLAGVYGATWCRNC